MSCSSQSPLAGQVRQSSGWSEMYSSMTPLRSLSSLGDWVFTFMPGEHGSVHDDGVPFPPSTSTRHSRHEPNASRLSVAHSLGMSTPASAAARMTDGPSGTVKDLQLISTQNYYGPSLVLAPDSV